MCRNFYFLVRYEIYIASQDVIMASQVAMRYCLLATLKLTLTLTLLLTLYGPTAMRLTLTDPRATFIEKSALQHYIEITYRQSIDNYSKLVVCANSVRASKRACYSHLRMCKW